MISRIEVCYDADSYRSPLTFGVIATAVAKVFVAGRRSCYSNAVGTAAVTLSKRGSSHVLRRCRHLEVSHELPIAISSKHQKSRK
jgi:hypothetical protein